MEEVPWMWTGRTKLRQDFARARFVAECNIAKHKKPYWQRYLKQREFQSAMRKEKHLETRFLRIWY